MFQTIYLSSIILVFILAFAVRNIKTYLSTGLSIKGKSKILSFCLFLSTTLYLLIIARLSFLKGHHLMEFDISDYQFLSYVAYGLVTMGFLIGLLALKEMKNSWRVGIRYEQKTSLINSGIYKHSRNPYFLSYNILILGYVIFFPSLFILIPYILQIIAFHFMILEEEKYLESIHGQEYIDYKNKVKRYLFII